MGKGIEDRFYRADWKTRLNDSGEIFSGVSKGWMDIMIRLYVFNWYVFILSIFFFFIKLQYPGHKRWNQNCQIEWIRIGLLVKKIYIYIPVPRDFLLPRLCRARRTVLRRFVDEAPNLAELDVAEVRIRGTFVILYAAARPIRYSVSETLRKKYALFEKFQ